MEILSVKDASFSDYGMIVEGYDFTDLLKALEEKTPLPEEGTGYVPLQPELQELPITEVLAANEFGGMPIQMGWCNGYNTKLNCLEYHRDSELDMGTTDIILLLAKREDMVDGRLDTAKVKAFLCPAGTMVELYATTLHYAPCAAKAGEKFKVLIVLPKGTNEAKPEITPLNEEDKTLWARNKWLLAHPESGEAAAGAAVRLDGENLDIAPLI